MEKGEQKQPSNVKAERVGFSCWEKWLGFAAKINKLLETFFYKYGYFISGYPILVIISCIIFTGCLGWGFAKQETETQIDKLYMPRNTRGERDLDAANKYFPVKARVLKVILLKKKGGNVLTPEILAQGFEVFKGIINIINFESYCIKSNVTKKPFLLKKTAECLRDDPFQLFNYSMEEIRRSNVTVTINKYLRDDSYLMKNFRPLSANLRDIFGKVKRDSFGNVTHAEAIRFQFFLKYPSTDQKYLEISNWAGEFNKYLAKTKEQSSNAGINIFYYSFASKDESVIESTFGDAVLIVITLGIMILFTCLVLFKFRNKVAGHALAGAVGLIAVIMGIGSGFGLGALCKVTFNTSVGLLPFMIIGVGVDDMFIILDELDRTDFNLPTREILATVLSKIGGSITMTTLTDLVAFAVSTMSVFPGVQAFCIYAALGITFSYLMIMTLFVAFLVFEVTRIKHSRYDIVPCIKSKEFTIDKDSGLACDVAKSISTKIMDSLAKFLMFSYVRYAALALNVALAALGIIGTLNISEVFSMQMLGKDGSSYVQYIDKQAIYFPPTVEVSIVVPGTFQLDEVQNQLEYLKLGSIAMTSSKYMQNRKVDWFSAFKNWADLNGRNITGNRFYGSLQVFLGIPVYSKYSADIKFSKDRSKLIASRILVFVKENALSTELKDAMLQLRDAMDKKSKIKPYLANLLFFTAENYAHVTPETTKNVIICGLTVVVITAPFLLHPGVLIFMLFNFSTLILELLGLMSIWNVSLNNIAMLLLTMAIGFSVDYSAHIGHAYMTSTASKAEDRVIFALKTAGASVSMGGLSTFLGVLVTAFASSEIFRIFFKMFFGIVVLGLLHGLIFLPAFLAVFRIRAVSRVNVKETKKVFECSDIIKKESQVITNPMTVS